MPLPCAKGTLRKPRRTFAPVNLVISRYCADTAKVRRVSGVHPPYSEKNTACRDPVSPDGPPVVFSGPRGSDSPGTLRTFSFLLHIYQQNQSSTGLRRSPAKVRAAFIDLRTFASRRYGPRSGRYPMKRKPPDWSREREPSRTHDATDRRRISPGRYKQSVGRCLHAGDNGTG